MGTDLFQLRDKDYLIVVDYTSKYFEVSVIPNTLASTVIQHTKSIFVRFGIPKIVISDNGPQYSSREYKKFAKEWGFHHDTSSPKYPKSNGLVERTVQTVNRTIKIKALKNGNDPCLALRALRSTPGVDNSPSPAFKLMNRHLRTPLPSIRTEKVSPTVPQSTKVKQYYNMHAKNLLYLNDGQSVRVRNGESWSVKGKVVGKARQPRSYVVKTTIRRNRRDLLITPEKFELREIPYYESELPTSPAVESRPHQETQLVTSPTIPMPNQSTTTSPVASANIIITNSVLGLVLVGL